MGIFYGQRYAGAVLRVDHRVVAGDGYRVAVQVLYGIYGAVQVLAPGFVVSVSGHGRYPPFIFMYLYVSVRRLTNQDMSDASPFTMAETTGVSMTSARNLADRSFLSGLSCRTNRPPWNV